MSVATLAVDPFTNMPIVILKDASGKQSVPIWIGLVEASAIASEIERIQLDRPMTHDLMRDLLEKVGAAVDRVDIHDLREHVFYATLWVRTEGGKLVGVDARPSDAIALALRAGAPIRVAQRVIDAARRIDLRMDPPPVNLRRDARAADEVSGPAPEEIAAELLDSLSPAAFGKWKM